MGIRRNLPPYPPEEHVPPDCDCTGKTCAGCGEVKCLGFFHRRGLFGYKSKCKACKSEESKTEKVRQQRKEAYWRDPDKQRRLNTENYEKHAEQRRAYAREYRQNNLESKREYDREYNHSERRRDRDRDRYQRRSEQVKARGKAWREANPERVRQHNQEWREANPERARLNVQKWYETNPERVRLHNQIKGANRRARKKQAGGKYTTQEWEALKAMYNYTCLCCRRQEPEIVLEPDHVVPLAEGGANTIDNIQPLCVSCNRKKSAKIIDFRL